MTGDRWSGEWLKGGGGRRGAGGGMKWRAVNVYFKNYFLIVNTG